MSVNKSGLDAVAVNAIWEEACKKEQRSLKLGGTFQITDARKLDCMAEKPNRIVPDTSGSRESISGALNTLAKISALKDTDKVPHERFALPVTGNMEYGFFSHKPLLPTNQMFEHKHRDADITKYANIYAQSHGTGPYNTKH